jgi:ribosomal protein S18 acetylase RimI-like enzyme
MTTHVDVVDALSAGRMDQARALTIEYLALTDVEAGLPAAQGFEELRAPLQEVVRTLADRHRPPGVLLLALLDGQPCGTVAMRRSNVSRASDALVQRLYVPMAYRRLGVARRLMTTVHVHSATAGFARTVLAVMPSRTGAIALYRSLGYLPLTEDVAWGWAAVGLCRNL